MRTTIAAVLFAVLAAAGCKDKPSLAQLEKLKEEACACQDKACADKVEKKAEKLLTDDALKAHGDKGIEIAFGVAGCLARYQ